MAGIINLKRARKAQARAAAATQAAENRAAHGRTKAEKLKAKAQAEQDAQRHEGHKRERKDPE